MTATLICLAVLFLLRGCVAVHELTSRDYPRVIRRSPLDDEMRAFVNLAIGTWLLCLVIT